MSSDLSWCHGTVGSQSERHEELGRTSTIRGCQWLGAWLATWLNRNLGMLRIKRISLKRTETM